MQVMPDTYSEMAAEHSLGTDPFNARDNIMAGTAYLRWLHKKYGNPKMFAAYNAGPGRVEKGGKLPAETRAYVSGIAKTLGCAMVWAMVPARLDLVSLTRPNGAALKIDASKVTAIRAALPGEYADSVKSVVTIGTPPAGGAGRRDFGHGRHQGDRRDDLAPPPRPGNIGPDLRRDWP